MTPPSSAPTMTGSTMAAWWRPPASSSTRPTRPDPCPIHGASSSRHRSSRARTERRRMRILHVLDHSIPLHSGYSFRTQAILEQQRAMGWQTFNLTSGKHHLPCPAREDVEGLTFYRTAYDTSFIA